jgi:hypothetical protein
MTHNGAELLSRCLKVIDSQSASPNQVGHADRLVSEWKRLMAKSDEASLTPHTRQQFLETQKGIQAELEGLYDRMASFMNVGGLAE